MQDLQHMRDGFREHRTDDERERRIKPEEEAARTIWRRRKPHIAFQRGRQSPEFVELDRDGLMHVATRYLEEAWMSHPALDWMIADALVTNELCAFGEAIKRDIMRFPRDSLGMNKFYDENEGDLQRMRSFKTGDGWHRLAKPLVGLLGPPILAGWMTDQGLPFVELVTYVWYACMAWFVGLPVLRAVARGFGRTSLDPEAHALKLWKDMLEVWRLLAGPVLNPTMIRDELMRTRAAGAAWDPPIFSIVDRAIARDPAVWSTLVQQRGL